ncbi:MAG: hypothetical protein ACE5IR_11965 [bacterium]
MFRTLFCAATTLKYGLPKPAEVLFVIYNMIGQHVRILIDTFQTPGFKTARLDGRDDFSREVSSGVYISRLRVGGAALTGKVNLQK